MKNPIKLLSIAATLAVTLGCVIHAQAQGYFIVESETGSTNTSKCGFQEFESTCSPMVNFYASEAFHESKSLTQTGSDWFGNFSYNATCVSPSPIIGGSATCNIVQTNGSGSCSFGDDAWSATGSWNMTNGWIVTSTNTDTDTSSVENLGTGGCDVQAFDILDSGPYTLGLWITTYGNGSWWDPWAVTTTTSTSRDTTYDLPPDSQWGGKTGTGENDTTLSTLINTKDLFVPIPINPGWDSGGGSASASLSIGADQSGQSSSGARVRVLAGGVKGDFQIPYVLTTTVEGVSHSATNFVNCHSEDGSPQYFPSGQGLPLSPVYAEEDNSCGTFYVGGSASISFLPYYCFGDENDDGHYCEQCLNCSPSSNTSAPGMPHWWVTEPYINLWVADKPVEYTSSLGENINFSITYKQRDERPRSYNGQQPFLPINGWDNNWYSYVHFTGQALTNSSGLCYGYSFANWTATVYQRGGGAANYAVGQNGNDTTGDQLLPMDGVDAHVSPATPWVIGGGANVYGANGFRLVHPDGSQDIYGLVTPLYPTNYAATIPVTVLPGETGSTFTMQQRDGALTVEDSSAASATVTPVEVGTYGSAPISGGVVVPDPGSFTLDTNWAANVVNFVTTDEPVIMSNIACADALLTEHIDPFGNVITLNYTSTGTNYQLANLTDYDGKVTTFYYDTNGYLSEVSMPYGRNAFFTYGNNTNAELLSVTDAQGMSSYFSYFGTGGITYNGPDNPLEYMTTPYGITTFAISETNAYSQTKYNSGVTRAISILNPDGTGEMYAYFNDVTNGAVPNSYPAAPTPPDGFSLDNGDPDNPQANMNLRDSFYWGPEQFTNLSVTGVNYLNSLTPHDFLLGRMSHWKLAEDGQTLSGQISMTQDASPDGQNPGLQSWYGGSWQCDGDDWKTPIKMHLMPDGTTWYEQFNYDNLGELSGDSTSYTASDGSIQTRGTYFYHIGTLYSEACPANNTTNTWWAETASGIAYPGRNDQIDGSSSAGTLNIVTNRGGFVFTRSYPHWNAMAIDTYDGVAYQSFNSREQLTGSQSITGLHTTNYYDASGFLSQSIALDIAATNNYTFVNGDLFSRTDPMGLTTLYSWDHLDRLTGITYPDATTVSNVYTYLDLTAHKDRLGNWSYAAYNSMRQKTSSTDPLSNVTSYGYCLCGGLDAITDPLNNTTLYQRNYVGWVTNVIYSDAYGNSTSRQITRDAVGRATSVVDSSGLNLTYTYGLQDAPTNISSPYGNVLAVTYNNQDRPVMFINADGVGVTNQYDGADRLTESDYAEGILRHYHYTYGLVDDTYDGFGRNTYYYYDAARRLIATTDANNNTNGFTYTPGGQLAALADGKGNVTFWTYDSYGRNTSKTDGNGTVVFTNGYDAAGHVIANWTPAGGLSHRLYDANGNLRTNAYSSGLNVIATYDALNRIATMSDAVGNSIYTYTNFGAFMGALTLEAGPLPYEDEKYTYANRKLQSLALNQVTGVWTNGYNFDGLQRLQSITSPAGTFSYTYNGAGHEIDNLALPETGNAITESYDDAGQILSTVLKHGSTTLDSYAYGYDAAGNRTNATRADGSSIGYGYDNVNQLTGAVAYESGGSVQRGNENFGYGYDPAGNLQVRQNNTLVQTFSVDNANALVNTSLSNNLLTVAGSVNSAGNTFKVNGQAATIYNDLTFAVTNGVTISSGANTFTTIVTSNSVSVTNQLTQFLPESVTCTSDANGNLLSDGLRGFQYDCDNELTQITVTNVSRTQFVYDGFGRRRIRKDFNFSAGTYVETNEVHYVYDGMNVIQEQNSSSMPLVSYTRGVDYSGSMNGAGGIGGLLARTDGTGTSFYHSDGNGNITMLADASGNVKARYLYDPFGNTLGMWGPLAYANTYRFSSKEIDVNSGMYYYGYRYYAPNLQRWLNRDPIAEWGGCNLYRFVDNNAINCVDPSGLQMASYTDQYGNNYWWGAYSQMPPGYTFQLTPYNEDVSPPAPGFQWVTDDYGDSFQAPLPDGGLQGDPIMDMLMPGGGFLMSGERGSASLLTCPGKLPRYIKPPGWQSDWERGISSRSNSGKAGGESWWPPDGGEWHYHSVDRWHPDAHWDYNSWNQWNSPWQNIDLNGNVIPKR